MVTNSDGMPDEFAVSTSGVENDVPSVLLPGLLTTPDVWSAVVAAQIHEAPRRYLLPTCPPLDTVEAIAEAVVGALPERFHLTGFSFGGYVSLAILDRYPERVVSLSLVGSASHADNEAVAEFRQQCIDTVAAGNMAELAARLTVGAMYVAHAEHRELLRLSLQMADRYGAERFVAHLRACMARPDRTHVLANARIPMRFLTGASDSVVPLKLQQRSAHAAGTWLCIIPDAGHLVPLEQPEQLAEALRSPMPE